MDIDGNDTGSGDFDGMALGRQMTVEFYDCDSHFLADADAMKALFLGLRGIDVSALPEDVRSAHAELVEGIRLAGTVMKRLADAAAQGPDAFERAATALEPEQRKVEVKLSAAGLLLRTAVVKAGLDSSAVPDGPF